MGGFAPLPPSGEPPTTEQPTGTGGKLDKVTAQLQDLNKLVTTFGPLAGSSILLVKMMVSLLRKNGVETADFATEANRLEAELSGLQSDIDAYRAKFPKTDAPTG